MHFRPAIINHIPAGQAQSGLALLVGPDLVQGGGNVPLPQALAAQLLGDPPTCRPLLGETGAGQHGGVGGVVQDPGSLQTVQGLGGHLGVDLPTLQETDQGDTGRGPPVEAAQDDLFLLQRRWLKLTPICHL